MGRIEFRISKYEKFLELLSEMYGGCSTGVSLSDRKVWFRVDGTKVWLDIRFKKHYENKYYEGVKFMTYGVEWIRVIRIGHEVLKYDLYAYDMNVPVRDYIHEDSNLYSFLIFLRGVANSKLLIK